MHHISNTDTVPVAMITWSRLATTTAGQNSFTAPFEPTNARKAEGPTRDGKIPKASHVSDRQASPIHTDAGGNLLLVGR